jgi:hypothetical protein
MEHYNSVLEIAVLILGMHKWEPDISIGLSPALHLQFLRLQLNRTQRPKGQSTALIAILPRLD